MAEQNIALNRPTVASSYVKPYESARAINGSTTPVSRWLCNTLPGWMYVDLGVNGAYPFWINRWVVRHMTVAGWTSPDYNMCDFKLQGSNDKYAWYDIDSVVGNTVGITDRTFTAVAYRYVRLYVTKGLKCNPKLASAMEFEVYQSPALSSYLKNLTVSSGALSPSFVNTTFNYTTPNVAYSVASVAVTPTAEDSRAIIKVNDVVVTNGNSTNVALNVGSNAIKIQVTAADGRTTNTYTVIVVRDAASSDLSALSVLGGTTELITGFGSKTTSYNANVGNDITSVVVTPTPIEPTSTVTVNGNALVSGKSTVNLDVGTNTITILVTSATGGTTTYYVNVTRAAAPVPDLTDLVLLRADNGNVIPLDSAFDKAVTAYTAKAGTGSVNVSPTAEAGSAATITVKGQTVVSGGTTATPINVPGFGTVAIPVVVTVAGGVTKTYTITVRK